MAAKFIYPPDGNFSTVAPSGTVGINDGLLITYSSSWSTVNLTFGCEWTTGRYWPYEAKENPIPGSGTFMVNSLYKLGDFSAITRFPARCNLKLTNPRDPGGIIIGQDFLVVGGSGVATTTYMPFATGTAASRPSTVTVTSISNSGNSITPSQVSNSNSSSALGAGAIAGIVAGGVVGTIIIAILLWLLIAQRRIHNKLVRQQQEQHYPQMTSYVPIDGLIDPRVTYFTSELQGDSQVHEVQNTEVIRLHARSPDISSPDMRSSATPSPDFRSSHLTSHDGQSQEGRSLLNSPLRRDGFSL